MSRAILPGSFSPQPQPLLDAGPRRRKGWADHSASHLPLALLAVGLGLTFHFPLILTSLNIVTTAWGQAQQPCDIAAHAQWAVLMCL